MRETVDLDSAASSPSASFSAASTSRSDSPRTQAEMTRASSAFVRVTPRPNSCEQNFSSVSRSFGRLSSIGPIVVFTATGGCQPLRDPAGASSSLRSYLARPKNASTSASIDCCMRSRTVSRPTSSKTAARSRSELNSASISARTRVVGDTRGATGVGPPS